MLEVINTILLSIIQVISCTCIAKTIINKKIKLKSFKNCLILILLILTFYMFMIYNVGITKPILIYIILIFGYKYIFNTSFNESVITNFISMLLTGLSEIVVMLTVFLLKIPQSMIDKYLTNTPISNIMSLLVIIAILKLFKEKLIKLKLIMENEKITYIFYVILAFGVTLIISKNGFFRWDYNMEFIINAIIITILASMIVFLFIEKHKIHKKTEEFNDIYKQTQSIKTLLNRYKKYNHENKNQLIIIRENSIGNNKVTDYIDSILNENIGHEDKWISELSYIKDPGISGFLSVKINQMVDNKINVLLTISPKVKNFNFSKIKPTEYKDICRILGVYLDNAYEASKETQKKEVTIEILLENEKLLIITSNSYNGKMDLDKIDNEGYTTKGKEHGVGLSIVKDIINSNKRLAQKREIIKDYFYQYLYINK